MNKGKMLFIAFIVLSVITAFTYAIIQNGQSVSGSAKNKEKISINPTDKIIYNKSIDLNADKINETVKIVKSPNNAAYLYIEASKDNYKIPLNIKDEGTEGFFTSVDFQDLDNDGKKDIFVTIPAKGNPFNENYFAMYSYSKNKTYYFSGDNSDFDLTNFSVEFKFSYAGKGFLNITNKEKDFTGKIDIRNNSNLSDTESENKIYDKSWIDPSPVNINDNSRLMLVKSPNNLPEIKLTLAIYGQSSTDLIGEIDMFYDVNGSFKPVFNRFELLDFGSSKLDTLG